MLMKSHLLTLFVFRILPMPFYHFKAINTIFNINKISMTYQNTWEQNVQTIYIQHTHNIKINNHTQPKLIPNQHKSDPN